ncbi:MAG: hypothetical protein QOE70_6380 [Chthoniobacter sp.]|jgi:hypothetical protein|nr:hypothetical protein [Chthoniobacter sp.]
MPKDDKGKIKIRFFEVEVEGGSETLLEGVRTAAAVASRGSPVRVIKALPSSQVIPAQVSEPDLFDENEGEAEEEQEANGSSSAKPKKNRAYPTPEVLELDLTTGPLSLEDYAKSKSPSEDNKKYLVVAAWLKEQRATPQIGINHIWTCFRLLGWGVQKDMGQPFRSMKKIGWFKAGAERGTFEITHIGLDVVRKLNTGA